jgi:hypothetical protein
MRAPSLPRPLAQRALLNVRRRRVRIEGRPRDRDGVMVELSADADAVEFVELAYRRREIVLLQAPCDLEALGVPHPRVRWNRALSELDAMRQRAATHAERGWLEVRLLIEIVRVMEDPAHDSQAPARDDIAEAVLRLNEGHVAA